MTIEDRAQIKQQFTRYVIPSVASLWVYTIYTMVDGMFVAKGVGSNALAAVNLVMPLINIAFSMGVLLAVGASTRASIYKGQGDFEKANKIFTLGAVTVACLGILMFCIVRFNSATIVELLGATNSTKAYVEEYLTKITTFFPFYMSSYYLEVLVKADGYPQKAIVTTCVGASTNIILDYVFVIVLEIGVAGAAVATGLSQMITFSIFVHHYLSPKSTFKFVRIKIKVAEILKTARLGISDSITEVSVAVVTFVFNNVLIAVSGDAGVVIYTILCYVYQIVLMTVMGVNQGMQPLVSFYYGKREPDSYKYVFKMALTCAGVASAISFAIGVLYPNPIVAMFIDGVEEPDLFAHAIAAFRLFSIGFLPVGMVIILAGYFTALERPKFAMIVSMCRGLIFVLITLAVLTTVLGENGVWITMGVSETLALGLALVIYVRKVKPHEYDLLENNSDSRNY